jgi:23S rRNA (uracil1939-C5)-methyltransferase
MTEFIIKRLGHQGDGIADGPVYAPLTLPSEVITGTLDQQILRDVRIITPSSDRVRAACRHYKSCGGCSLMHASDPFVAEWKVGVVKTALAAHGLETELRPCLTSPAQSRRRATFSVRRTKKGASVGFHARGSDVIIENPDCQLLDPDLIATRETVAQLAVIGGSRKGEISINVTLCANGLDVAASGGKELDDQLRMDLTQACETLRLARLSWHGEVIAMRLPPSQEFDGIIVDPPSGSFLQATKQGEGDLIAEVRNIIGHQNRIIDLFAGCGTFSLPMARNAEVHAVEGEADMLRALDKAWRHATGLKRVTTETRDLFRRPLQPDELRKFDAAIIDPPRAGAEAQIDELSASDINLIAYVSCNPTTFARDAAHLVSRGFEIEFVQTVDQFRWSTHIELVAKFSRN